MIAVVAGCGVRAPAPIDVAALVKARGADEARLVLIARTIEDPRDVGAKLALARLEEETGRPSAAIEQLEAAIRLGGPLGTRWRDDDRARLARLLAARGQARVARGAPSGLADLVRAKDLGARVAPQELQAAKRAQAIARLRHVDAKERAAGARALHALAATPVADPSWIGAGPEAKPRERGAFGAWAWQVGARRAAWEALAAWRDAGIPDDALARAYLIARSWWTPHDGPRPAPADLVGAERCRYVEAACEPAAVALDAEARAALLAAPIRTSDPAHASGWLAITLLDALAGGASWGPAFAARVDRALAIDALPPAARAAFAHRTGRAPVDAATPTDDLLARYLIAAARALHGESAEAVAAALGSLAAEPLGAALVAVVQTPRAPPIERPLDEAALAYVRVRVPAGPGEAGLRRMVASYRRDPDVADRVGRELVERAVDAAAAHAAIGALFDAFADPARARASWQAAVDASPEPTFLRGLAEAIARAGDPDAALVAATTAAAASGDPATVWLPVSRTLEGVGHHVHALEAARYAIELAGADLIAPALEAAIEASASLGRTSQVDSLRTRLTSVGPVLPRTDDPTSTTTSSSDPSRRWIASRWNPRDISTRAALLDLPTSDPRRDAVVAELIALAADRDPALALAAVAALR